MEEILAKALELKFLSRAVGEADFAKWAILNADELCAAVEMLVARCRRAESVLDRLVKGFDQDIATTPRSYAADDCRQALAAARKDDEAFK